MKKLISFFLVMTIIVGQAAAQADMPKDYYLLKKSATSAVVRSLIIPGWGQSFLDKKDKGLILMIAAGAGLASALYFKLKSDTFYNDYENKGLRDDELYDDYIDYTNYMYYSLAFTAIVWLFGVLDAYSTGKKIENSRKKKKYAMYNKKDAFMVAYNIPF
ncbi:MAG: hypothetical protein ABH857_00735 [Elusimicrobiota bacterium]